MPLEKAEKNQAKRTPLEQHSRAQYIKFFEDEFSIPYFSVSFQLDVTDFTLYCKDKGLPLFHASLFVLTKTLNDDPAFRCRVEGEDVLEWKEIYPRYPVLNQSNEFIFCEVDEISSLEKFCKHSLEAKEKNEALSSIEESFSTRKDQIYVTITKSISFSAVFHPVRKEKDYVPRAAFGKIFEQNGRKLLPINLQLHHGFIDGFHTDRAVERMEEYFQSPSSL